MTKTDVATVKQANTAVAVAAGAYDYGADAGSGFEGTSQSDLTIPFLNVLQALSPEVEQGTGRLGEIFNTVTGEVIAGQTGLPFIPCYKEVVFVEWTPRAKGGGLVARHAPDSTTVKQALSDRQQVGKMVLPNGNELVETHYIYLLTLDEAGEQTTGFAVLSCSSTKITPVKKLLTALYMMKGKPPLFANRVKLTTVKESNEKGSFANVKFDPLKGTWAESLINPATHRALLDEGKAFREMIISGAAKMAEERLDAAPSAEGGRAASPKNGKAPF